MDEDGPVEDRLSVGPAPKRGMGTGPKILIGCAITLGVAIVLLIGTVVLFGKQILRFGVARGVDLVIESSTLSQTEKQDAKATVRRFLKQSMDGTIPQEKVEEILQLAMSGTAGRMIVIGAFARAVERSDLPPDEKATAKESVSRLMAGLAQKKISDEEFGAIAAAVPKDPEGNPKLPPWTDRDVKAVLAQIDAALEGKAIEPTDAPLDLADDLRKAVRMMKEAMDEQVEPLPAGEGHG